MELGTWKIYPVDLELKEVVKPICSITYSLSKLHEDFQKKGS